MYRVIVIQTRYIGPTNHRGSRIAVIDTWTDKRKVYPFSYAANDAQSHAVQSFVKDHYPINSDDYDMRTGGHHKHGRYYVVTFPHFDPDANEWE